jgi:glucose-6-phosphate isomerase
VTHARHARREVYKGGKEQLDLSASDVSNIIKDVHSMRQRIKLFSEQVRSGSYKSITGKAFKNLICIGIGGSHFGPECVAGALDSDAEGAAAADGRVIRFLANVDPVDFHVVTKGLDPEETLVIVANKTFQEQECMLNARTIKNWLTKGISEHNPQEVVMRHMIAVSANTTRCIQFGIAKDQVFQLWDWVNSRFSLCSPVGLLPLSLHFSYEVMSNFLDGAHDMDEHFFHAPLRDNIPVIMALLGIWNSTFLQYSCRAILPYSDALRGLSAHVAHVDMESNGKRVVRCS